MEQQLTVSVEVQIVKITKSTRARSSAANRDLVAIIFQASNRHRFAARQVRFLPLTRPTASVIVIDWHASMTGRGYSKTS
jgi:hypothetical protein